MPDTAHGPSTDVLTDIPTVTLYSIRAITLSTFFGGILCGGYMIAQNFRAVNENKKATITWVGTLAVVIFIVCTLFINIFDKIPSVAYSFLYTILAGSVARRYQSSFIEEHKIAGGALHGTGRIVLIVIIGLVTLLSLLFGIYYVAYYFLNYNG